MLAASAPHYSLHSLVTHHAPLGREGQVELSTRRGSARAWSGHTPHFMQTTPSLPFTFFPPLPRVVFIRREMSLWMAIVRLQRCPFRNWRATPKDTPWDTMHLGAASRAATDGAPYLRVSEQAGTRDS